MVCFGVPSAEDDIPVIIPLLSSISHGVSLAGDVVSLAGDDVSQTTLAISGARDVITSKMDIVFYEIIFFYRSEGKLSWKKDRNNV